MTIEAVFDTRAKEGPHDHPRGDQQAGPAGLSLLAIGLGLTLIQLIGIPSHRSFRQFRGCLGLARMFR